MEIGWNSGVSNGLQLDHAWLGMLEPTILNELPIEFVKTVTAWKTMALGLIDGKVWISSIICMYG
jgi:hypothetical protein